jgi:hypothetical protein
MGTRFVSKRSIAALGLITSPIQWLLRVPSWRVRRPEHETDHLPPYTAGVQNAKSYTSTPPYSLMICLCITTFTFLQGCKYFPNIYEPSQNSRPQKFDMEEVSNSGSTNVRRYPTKFSHHGDLAPGIYAPLLYFTFSTAYETILLKNC